VARHTERGGQRLPTLLLGVGADPEQAAQARAEGADLVDVRAASPAALAALRASLPGDGLWAGLPGDPVDADRLAARTRTADPDGQAPPAAVIATAGVCTWLGVPLVRSRHTRAVRRAIDMTASIAGHRPPARTIRGLA